MGQESFYCGGCKVLLRTRDLERGQAVRAGDQVFCKGCARAQGLWPPPGGPRMSETERIRLVGHGRVTETERIRLVAQGRMSETERIRLSITPRTPRPGSTSRAPGPLPILLAAGAGILFMILLFALSRPKPGRHETDRPVRPAPEVVVEPEPGKNVPESFLPPRRVERPKPASREAEARRLLDEARALRAQDLDAALPKARAALLEAHGTPLHAEAQRLEEELRAAQAERLARKKAETEARVKAAIAAEDFAAALRALEGDTTPAADARRGEIRRAVDGLWPPIKEKILAARRKGAAKDVDTLRARVERWGLPAVQEELKAVLAMPVEVEPTPWQKRLAELAFPIDYAALAKESWGDSADLDVLRLAGEVQRELGQIRPKFGAELAGGRVLRSTPHAVELLIGDERRSLPILELPLDVLKAGPAALAAYRALEGEGGNALPPNLRALADRHAKQREAPAEIEARKLFAEAEREFARPTSRLAAGAKFAAIPKETLFARRYKGLLEERIAAAAEVFLGVEEMSPEGACVPSEAIKGTPTLSFLGDGAARVDAEAARAWVYAGACCLEIFVLQVRAPDPLPLKTSHTRAKHAHSGRELRWTWVPVPLPPGTRSFRVCSDREGVSIAYVWISNGRPGPPRDSDLAAFEKSLDVELPPAPRGSLLREVWTDLPGFQIAAVSGRPASAGAIASFEGPTNIADNYLARVRGYLHPPSSGDYTFYLASDDSSELWISADETPSKKRLVLALNGATSPRGWDEAMAPKPVVVNLKAGKRYYVELLHKEGPGEDNFAVGWRLPDGTMERPIPGSRLSPYVGGGRARGASMLYRAIDFNGAGGVIDGQSWEGKDAPNLTHNGRSEDFSAPGAVPPVDAAKTRMLQTFIWNPEGLSLTMSNVPPGRYLAYVYIWEDNGNQVFDILLNNRVVKEKHNSGDPGRWERVGPWPLDVADGKIELRCGKGEANVSGLEIWKSR